MSGLTRKLDQDLNAHHRELRARVLARDYAQQTSRDVRKRLLQQMFVIVDVNCVTALPYSVRRIMAGLPAKPGVWR